MGAVIARDPRFSRCTVESFAELLWKRSVTNDDFLKIDELRQAFEQQGMHPQELIKSILNTNEYQHRAMHLLSPDQYASALYYLTGFRWTWQGYDQMDNDTYGYRVLSGGVDGSYVLEAPSSPHFTQVLSIQRLAEAAAWTVVNHDIMQDQTPKYLFVDNISSLLPADDAFFDQLTLLHWQLYGKPPSEDWISAIVELWKGIERLEDGGRAWQGILTAMFQDPEMMGY